MLKILIYGAGVLMISQVLQTALALQCYQCSGPKGQQHDCDVNLGNVNVQNCTPGFVCTLYINTVGNQSTINRLCSESNECEVVQAKNTHTLGDTNRTVDICTTCSNKDLCNSSESYIFNTSMLSLVLSSFSFVIINFAFNKALF